MLAAFLSCCSVAEGTYTVHIAQECIAWQAFYTYLILSEVTVYSSCVADIALAVCASDIVDRVGDQAAGVVFCLQSFFIHIPD